MGIDSRNPGGTIYDVLAVAPVCGNGGMPEHSETCDNNDDDPGNVCDSQCRAVLNPEANEEVEPNDDFVGANVVTPPSGESELTVRGNSGGRCDFDMFVLSVPEGGSVQAELLNVSGLPCTPNIPPTLSLRFVDQDGITERGKGMPNSSNQCPSIDATATFARDLLSGEYYVRVTSGEGEGSLFSYQLRFVVLPSSQ